jgi:hypothetical protein
MGAPVRQKTPPIDPSSLEQALCDHVATVGVRSCFGLSKYHTMVRELAVDAPSMCLNADLMERLLKVSGLSFFEHDVLGPASNHRVPPTVFEPTTSSHRVRPHYELRARRTEAGSSRIPPTVYFPPCSTPLRAPGPVGRGRLHLV